MVTGGEGEIKAVPNKSQTKFSRLDRPPQSKLEGLCVLAGWLQREVHVVLCRQQKKVVSFG